MRLLPLALILQAALAATSPSSPDLIPRGPDDDHGIIVILLQAAEATKKCTAAIEGLAFTPNTPANCTDIVGECSPILDKVGRLLPNLDTMVDKTSGEVRLVFRKELNAVGQEMEKLAAATTKKEAEHKGFLEPCLCEMLQKVTPALEKQLVDVVTSLAASAGLSTGTSDIATYAALLQALLAEGLTDIKEAWCGSMAPTATPGTGGNVSVTLPQPTPTGVDGSTGGGGSTGTGGTKGPNTASAAGLAPQIVGVILAVAFGILALA